MQKVAVGGPDSRPRVGIPVSYLGDDDSGPTGDLEPSVHKTEAVLKMDKVLMNNEIVASTGNDKPENDNVPGSDGEPAPVQSKSLLDIFNAGGDK